MQSLSVVSVPVSGQERSKRFSTSMSSASSSSRTHRSVTSCAGCKSARPERKRRWLWSRGSTRCHQASLRGLVLDTDDIEADYGSLLARGASLSGPPSPEQAGGVFCFVSDPDGNKISLHQRGG